MWRSRNARPSDFRKAVEMRREDHSIEASLARMEATIDGADRVAAAADAYVYASLGGLVVMLAAAVFFAGIGGM